jgi:hypothetical protein
VTDGTVVTDATDKCHNIIIINCTIVL